MREKEYAHGYTVDRESFASRNLRVKIISTIASIMLLYRGNFWGWTIETYLTLKISPIYVICLTLYVPSV